MKRRAIDLRSFDALRAEVMGLRGRGYQRAGAWSLGQNCEHVAIMLDQSIDGFDARLPWFIRMGGPLVKWWLLRSRRMPSGVQAPRSFLPTNGVSDTAGVDRLLVAIDRYVQYDGPMQASPLLGPLPREDWDQIHLIHASHHLSFILPEAATAEASPATA